jgi:hypothetical protein
MNFVYFGALILRKQSRNSAVLSRRAAPYGQINVIVGQVPSHYNHLDVSFLLIVRANLLSRIRAAARQIHLLAGSRKAVLSKNGTSSAMAIPAPAAAWVSAPIPLTRKVLVIFPRQDSSAAACENRIFLMTFDEFR